MKENTGQIILYQTEDGATRIELKATGGTVWLTQSEIAELFQRERSVITKHINNILAEEELLLEQVCANFAHQYGYGLIIAKINGQTIYRHGGWLLGIRTDLSCNPANGVSVMMLSNLSPVDNQQKKTTYTQVGSFTD